MTDLIAHAQRERRALPVGSVVTRLPVDRFPAGRSGCLLGANANGRDLAVPLFGAQVGLQEELLLDEFLQGIRGDADWLSTIPSAAPFPGGNLAAIQGAAAGEMIASGALTGGDPGGKVAG